MAKIALTGKAESDLGSIYQHYVGKTGIKTADQVIRTLLNSLELLSHFPGAGRPSPVPDIRELVFTNLPFVAPYRLKGQQIQVLRILHQRFERPGDW
ncbi:type II toxin-antitoxin system RelE/ParE family toxin [Pseudomonas fontis]|uniref:Type II toxin-antitoxin system RelE/ParE family toxin n=1 Tax=Pseudomonas fontis TaxID=2942633 RepID=A0ABT5NZL8_9PSED|nr:type II toxin-antitoxin system RelE/ParE family toxin [Pseudomonas fontis]MDD0974101.1 type II toxin-antitoxin system RelE/ParE family toxin [Pseudomonas fontis]MDD0993658.1 type II toxin-antitoxin system RelE/ParE family toxin [Pseudomonas fontis]